MTAKPETIINHSDRIHAQYLYELKKHPYFCDVLFHPKRAKTDGGPNRHLQLSRNVIRKMKQRGELDFIYLADQRLAEMFARYMKGDNDAAVEKCYALIVVLLRAIDVLECRQELGKPKKRKGGAA